MANVWASGRLKAVFHQIGNHANGSPKYRRAQYDFLSWDSNADGVEEQYVVSPAGAQINSAEINETGQQHELGSFFGFYEPGAEVIDASNPGDIDTWNGLHSFGFY